MNMKKSIAAGFTALAVTAMATVPAAAASSKAGYCDSKARTVANNRALGSTAVGAVGGCIIGALISHKCGVGAAVGGVGGFAIGSAQWKAVYNQVYWRCMKN